MQQQTDAPGGDVDRCGQADDGAFEQERLPMSGVRVIDVGNFLAGPHAASILGEFGAEVLKVEHPIAGDPMRRYGTQTKRHDATLAWLSEGRNRKSVTIDLRQGEGVRLFLKLVEKSDVLVENFRPGTMEEWGLGWDAVSAANPRVVMLRVSSYGQTGPYRFGDRQFHARRNLVAIDEPETGETIVVPNVMPKLSESPGRIKHLGPTLGEHTAEVLRDVLGMDDQQIEELRGKRVI